MARDIDGLLIQIEASTASLRSEMKRADAAVANATKGIDKQLSVVDKAFANIGVTAGRARQAANTAMIGIAAGAATAVAGVTALTKQVIDSAREIQNFSSVSNSTTLEFQRFAAGAKAVGIEQEKLADQLKDVNDRIGQFATSGSGEMAQFFEKIAPRVGVTAEQFRKLSGPQALQLYYNSLEKAGLNQQEMTAYMEAMADESTALIPLLRNGGEGFKLLGDEAERAGAILDDKAIRAAQEMNAALILMTNATGGVKNRIATALLPVLLDFSEGLNTLSVDSAAASIVTDDLAESLRVLGQGAVGAVAAIHLAGKSIKGIYDLNEASKGDGSWWETFVPPVRIYRAFESFDDIKESFGDTTSDLDSLANSYADFLNKIGGEDGDQANSKIKTLADLLNEARETAGSFIPPATGAAKAIEKVDKALDGVDADGPAKAIAEYKKELEALEDKINPAGKAAKDFAAEQKRLREEIERTGDPTGKWTALLQENERQFEQNIRATSEWAKWTEGALDRVDSAFADAWRNIGDGFSSFRDSLTDAFKQMLAELAHMAITRPIIMQIGAALGIGGGAGQAVSMMGGTAGSGGLDAFSLLKNGYSIANSGFGQAVMGGWNSGQGVWGGLQNAASSGWQYGSSALGSMFGSGGSGVMVDGVYQLGANTMPATVDLIGNTVSQGGNIIGTASGATTTATTWGSAATGLGSIMGGLSGAYMGYQNSGVKGAVAGGLGGWGGGTLGTMAGAAAASALSGTAMGAALGSVLPGIGTVIGAALGAAFGSKLFGGAWETKDAGLAFSVEGGQFDAQQFEYQKKKGGLFSSNKKRTRFSDLDEATAAQFQGAFDATGDTVASIFETLSLTVEESSLAGLQMAREKISTKGKTEEEIQEAISEWFLSLGNSMTAELNKVFATGLDYDLADMQAFVGNLQGVNEVLRYLDVSMYDMTVAGGKLAESLSSVAGGLDALATNSQTYYSAFFSESEKVEDTIDSIKRAFESADVELVGSREAYRAMVEDIDLTTEAGQEMFSLMMALSGQAAQYFSIVEQQAAQATAAANAALFGAVDTAYAALQRSIAAQQQEIQQAASATTSNISALTGVSNSLDAALKRLRGTSDETVKSLRAQAVMTLNSALVQARSGQSLAGFEGLQDALDTASQMDTALYGSLADFEREQGRTANLIAELEKVNGKQLTTEQKALKELEAQSSALDRQLAFAQAQLDALNGVDASVLSVAEAIKAMNASVVAAMSLMGGDTGKNATPGNVGTLADSVYRSVLGREADAAGLAYWQGEVASGNIRLDQLEQAIKNAAKQNGEIPGYAAGGYTGAGDKWEPAGIVHKGEVVWSQSDIAKWGGVGTVEAMRKGGPELEVTGPSRIYNASQTAAMLGGGGDAAAEVRALRTAIHTDLQSIAKHTMNTAKRLDTVERMVEDWDINGLPKERGAA